MSCKLECNYDGSVLPPSYPVLISGLNRDVLQHDPHCNGVGGASITVLITNVDIIHYNLHTRINKSLKGDIFTADNN